MSRNDVDESGSSVSASETSSLLSSTRQTSDASYDTASSLEQHGDGRDLKSSSTVAVDDIETTPVPETSALGRNLSWTSAYLLTISRVLGSGIFATPGIILASVGSPGLSLTLWVVGAVLAFLGLAIYLELGCMLPRSGSDKVYLEFAFRRPKYFTSVVYAIYALLLGLTATNCVVFAQYTLFAFRVEGSETSRKALAIGLLTAITIVHGVFRKTGIWLQDLLGWVKIGLILFMVVSGIVAVIVRPAYSSSTDLAVSLSADPPIWGGWWAGSIWSWGAIATSILKVFYSFAGLSNVNNVLNEVKNPVRTVKTVSIAAFVTACAFYALANVAYLLVVPLDEFKNSGELIAALFFERVFGPTFGRRFLPIMVALSAVGNVMVVTFALSRLNQEIARTGLIPCSRILSSTAPFGSPLGGLVVHYIPSALVLLIPSGDIYSFILEVENYAGQIVGLAVSASLLWLRYKRPDLERPVKAWLPGVVFRCAISIALLLAPFFPSESQKSHGRFRGIAYALVGYAVLFIGVVYWWMFAKLLPRWGKYQLEDQTETLDDGTTVRKIARLPLHTRVVNA